jgi:16S rRNA (adenine1518-N6/adenine1519-N6)-dimethyltransferase
MKAKKRFGQVFLTGPRQIDAILRAVSPYIPDTVMEIGPGTGALTAGLAERAQKVIAVEIENEAFSFLAGSLGHMKNIEFVHADFLKLDSGRYRPAGGKLVAVGNLPYNAASLILLKLIREREAFSHAFVMLQREVAGRLTSPPGRKAYGFLTVAVGAFARVKKLVSLSGGAFRPVPRVKSTFLHLDFTRPGAPAVSETGRFLEMASRAFSQRRKKVINVLAGFYPAEKLDRFFAASGISRNARAEALSVQDYIGLLCELL